MATSLVSTGVQFPDATIQTTAADNMQIKSIQRGSITITGYNTSQTATIASVNTSKTELRFLGNTGMANYASAYIARIQLTDSTTITAIRSSNQTNENTTVSWELTEWY